MKLLHSPAEVQDNFDQLKNHEKSTLEKFVHDNFSLENQMEEFDPIDWKPQPKLISRIQDLNYARFAQDLNGRWKMLCRKIKAEVEAQPDRYSLLYLPHPVIVPGGRFREVYYWDSFWIIRGLLQCEMYDTVKGMLLNFVHLIRQFGKIPNGGRKYYLNRSQPPLFIPMVREYERSTGDSDFVKSILPEMVAEFSYWQNEHLVTFEKDGRMYSMVRYNCQDDGPRPESYFEDYNTVRKSSNQNHEVQNEMYWELKTGAETGWDYSTRWYIPTNGDLQDTKPRSIIPVDLNCFHAQNAQILSEYFTLFQNDSEAQKYQEIYRGHNESISQVLWHAQDGIWYDYDFQNSVSRPYFSPSNLTPLWTGNGSKAQEKSAVDYLSRQNLEDFPGGVPTTFQESGQQWDFPNCWPPLEHILVQGLEKTGLPEARQMAFTIASQRVQGCYVNFQQKGHMFEKYDATQINRIGSGGEYEVQLGFGWTNGVVLDFLDMYSDQLSTELGFPVRKLSGSRGN